MFRRLDGIKYRAKRRTKSKRRNNKSKSRRRSKSIRRRIIKRSKSSKRRMLKKSYKKDGMHSTAFKFFRIDMGDGITLYGVREEISTYLYIYIPKDYVEKEYLGIYFPTGTKDKDEHFELFVQKYSGFNNAKNFDKHLKVLNLNVNDDIGYIFYIKINDDITDEQIIQYMNDFYYKFQKTLLSPKTRLEKELLILEKDRDKIKRKEFRELIDEKILEDLNVQIDLITNKIQKIENEEDIKLHYIRGQNEQMLFVIYKTIDDLREYFIKKIRDNSLKLIYSNRLNEYIKLIREKEELGLKDPLSENKFLSHFYENFPFKSKLRHIQDSKPDIFKDK